MHPLNWYACTCSSEVDKLTPFYFAKRFFEELIEFLKAPSKDELSDCMLMITQFIYVVTGHVVIMPYAQLSLQKGRDRVNAHGCVRSKRNSCCH